MERHQERAFTRIGAGSRIADAKIAEVAAVVAAQVATAKRLGAEHVRVVATAAIRGAGNRADLLAAIPHDVVVLDGEEEARLAFLGATSTYAGPLAGRIAVVDVGGGSTEIAIGNVGGAVEWWASSPIGSGALAERHLRTDPPARAELDALRAEADAALAPLEPPRADARPGRRRQRRLDEGDRRRRARPHGARPRARRALQRHGGRRRDALRARPAARAAAARRHPDPRRDGLAAGTAVADRLRRAARGRGARHGA